MVHDILLALWFLLPAGFGNLAPIIAPKIPGIRNWNTPIDGGRKFRGVELLGTHKTWRGIVSGVIASTIVFALQKLAFDQTGWGQSIAGPVDYSALPLILGPLFGLGALGGDAVKSFFKRQMRIPAGKSWLPFDQLDYIIGGILVSLPFVILKPVVYIWMFVLYFGLHLITSYLGWKTGFKERPI
jgi:CDP-2,3-bis-(O-geranylgeranyl)-sn-glycerol synthase